MSASLRGDWVGVECGDGWLRSGVDIEWRGAGERCKMEESIGRDGLKEPVLGPLLAVEELGLALMLLVLMGVLSLSLLDEVFSFS